jgi:cytosine/adenosine deaminase-related metal-dependent hydrolase
MSSSLLLKSIYTLQTGFDKEALHGADLLIVDNKVSRIDPAGKISAKGVDRVIDCSKHVVLPGLVNTHHHFYQTLTRNHPAVQSAKLFDWLTFLYDVWKYLDEEGIYYSSLLAMAELMRTGCTLTTDHHYVYPHHVQGDPMAIQFEAAETLGMRFSPTRGSMSLSKKDGGLPPDTVVQTEEQILFHSEESIRRFHDDSADAMRKVALAPCSPFSVTKELMKESAALARKYGVRLHTHLCETADENDFCLEMYEMRPVELMQECDLIGEDVYYAHGIYFNDEELKIIADTGSHIAHCPSSNMRLGSGICRVHEMLPMGINIGIAVDGSASNDSSDMLAEVRQALLLQRVRYGSDALTAKEAFTMGTINGAKMLNFTNVGKLEEGWAADAAIWDLSTAAYAGAQSDPVAALLFCGDSHYTDYTIINGKVVVDRGTLVGFDEALLTEKANAISKRMLDRAARKEAL